MGVTASNGVVMVKGGRGGGYGGSGSSRLYGLVGSTRVAGLASKSDLLIVLYPHFSR